MYLEIGMGSNEPKSYDSKIIGKYAHLKHRVSLGFWFGHPVEFYWGTEIDAPTASRFK
jgi:hypothetical protein